MEIFNRNIEMSEEFCKGAEKVTSYVAVTAAAVEHSAVGIGMVCPVAAPQAAAVAATAKGIKGIAILFKCGAKIYEWTLDEKKIIDVKFL